ncbi:unnamed protein product [Tuber aestivum]|uniref:Uncharacterized protein n=1 Tax=Tuber aestivum TaxID=59557 RepID=A0A292PPA6_9PEZI|nr:unnamed protein product [Tuber aestivum]
MFELFLEKTKLLLPNRGAGFRADWSQRFGFANAEAVPLAFRKRKPQGSRHSPRRLMAMRCRMLRTKKVILGRVLPCLRLKAQAAIHERASPSFLIELAFKIAAIPGHSKNSFLPVGSTRFPVPGKRSKESDEGIKPADTRADEDEWPSLMIEVGVSQTMLSLRESACWWLANSKERTRMVILIRIKKDPMSLRLERRERVIDTDRPSTRSRQTTTPNASRTNPLACTY